MIIAGPLTKTLSLP